MKKRLTEPGKPLYISYLHTKHHLPELFAAVMMEM